MLIKELLNSTTEELKEAADAVLRDCKQFLQEIKDPAHSFIFRGINSNRNNIFMKKEVPINRRPKDMPLDLHEFFDDWFKRKYGSRFRSEAVFATNKTYTASGYGTVRAIYPIGTFKYIWSPEILDLWDHTDQTIISQISKLLKSSSKRIHPFLYGHEIEDPTKVVPRTIVKRAKNQLMDIFDEDELEEMLELNTYTNTGLSTFAKNKDGGEIMIECSEYYAISLGEDEAYFGEWQKILSEKLR